MRDDEFETLKKEVRELRASIADIRRAFELDSDNTTGHIKSIYQYIADIHDYLMPVVHKVFPGFTEDKKQIDAFMRGRGPPSNGKKAP